MGISPIVPIQNRQQLFALFLSVSKSNDERPSYPKKFVSYISSGKDSAAMYYSLEHTGWILRNSRKSNDRCSRRFSRGRQVCACAREGVRFDDDIFNGLVG
jgi:hypothetical protein